MLGISIFLCMCLLFVFWMFLCFGSSSRFQGAEQKILLSISIPPGVSAGQTLGVKVPDGRELTVVVPPGANDWSHRLGGETENPPNKFVCFEMDTQCHF